MNNDSDFAHGKIGERALVAAFAEPEGAHLAAKVLRDEGFHHIWIGITRGDTTTVTSEDNSIPAKLGRYISGEGDGLTLVDTLARHGVSGTEARRVEEQLQPSDVILTVNGSNHPELAANVIEDAGGDILSGESFVFTTVDWTMADGRMGSELLGYQDPSEFARGERVDDDGMTRLRNERLRSSSVPTQREEFFIARFDDYADDRGKSEGSSRAGAAIGTRHRTDISSTSLKENDIS